ncbi:hypothetical protein ACIG47_23990 [Promicromonospora sp. NPDC052451]|uniref:hypothetical protein n=1 Tax=unclassified Promicromonospora TaxID=2647929 RepID=UPI0037C9F8E8
MITSEMVSILSVGLPAVGALVSALVSFLGVLPGTERRLHRLVAIHRDMPDGHGKAALEDALNELAVRTARRAVSGRVDRRPQRPRRRVDGAKVTMVVIVVLVGGGLAWFFWWLGTLAPWAFLQWTLWVVAALVTVFTTFVVTLDNVFKDDDAAPRRGTAEPAETEADPGTAASTPGTDR